MKMKEIEEKRVSALNCVRCLLLGALAMALLTLHNCDAAVVMDGDSLPLGASLTGNQTLISKNGTFALGFFNPDGTNNWYLAIWYAKISQMTTVWVANRETPVKQMPGILKLTRDGHLSLFDSDGRSVWSTDNELKASRALILESGNFVVVGHNKSEIIWESFGHPGDTWLPEMFHWKGLKLTSWRSSVDPAPGSFSFGMDPSPGKTEYILVYNKTVPFWSSGEWKDDHFTNLPEMPITNGVNISFVKISPTRMSFVYTLQSKSQMVRAVLHTSGTVRTYMWIESSSRWSLIWSLPHEQCAVYDVCGAYGVCTDTNVQSCSCLQGFIPKDQRSWDSEEWSASGCVRRSPLQCSSATDDFREFTDKSLPRGDRAEEEAEQTLQGCKSRCLKNCSCTAFAVTNSITPVCELWFGDLLNVRDSSNGQSFYVRLAISDLLQSSSSNKRGRGRPILLLAVAASVTVTILLILLAILWRRKALLKKRWEDDSLPSSSLRTFSYKELQIATDNFRHKLGSGAFASVFKGSLPDNSLVAVKELEEDSRHAEKQFRAEISTIGMVSHVNLVRLRGFCCEGHRRLLVYEYVSKGSLSSLLFSTNLSSELQWKTRFQIALGTARGLVYLHEECSDRIIHCDIKPENILLDENLCPKVADFGLAKSVGRDLSRVLTTTRGTRGYLAPEWITGLPITPKVDVSSFGKTLLEIISGRRNLDLNAEESSMLFFPTWAATQVNKGSAEIAGTVDSRIANNADMEEVRRCIIVGLLCIEEEEDVRPSMAEVVQMLEGTMDAHPPQIQTPELLL